jgi:micrococcal nuclease
MLSGKQWGLRLGVVMAENLYQYKVSVARIVDGDTVDVDVDLGFGVWLRNERIRLAGVDTPEKRTRDPIEKKAGVKASEFTAKMLTGADEIILVSHEKGKGKYGRILGTLMCDGMSLNDALISSGNAKEYWGGKKT